MTVCRISCCEHLCTLGRFSRTQVFAWCSFDWANSGFPTVIMTFVFSAYFTQAVAASPNAGTGSNDDPAAVALLHGL